MRTAILFIVTLLLPVLAFSQNGSQRSLTLKNGTTIKGEVEIQDDGTYQVKTASGDVFYFMEDEIKKGNASNTKIKIPKNASNSVVFRSGNQLYYVDGLRPLSQDDFNTLEGWNTYMKASKKGESGRIVTRWGSGAFLLGGVLVGIGYLAGQHGDMGEISSIIGVTGLFLAGAGLITDVTGLCIIWSSNSKLNKIAKGYNQTPGYALNFGVQQHGIGLSLTF